MSHYHHDGLTVPAQSGPPPGLTVPAYGGPPPGLTIPSYNDPPPIMTQPPTTIITVHSPELGPGPAAIVCPSCGAQVMTAVTDVSSGRTHGYALLICCLGGIFGCCLIPYCVSSCQAQRHDCPNCGHYLGEYKSECC